MNEIHDIRPIIEMLPFWEKHLLWFMILGGMVVAWVIYKLLRKYGNKSKRGVEQATAIDPYKRAMMRLDEAKRLMVEGADKELATVLSDGIREYLEAAHKMKAMEVTTEEFLVEMMNSRLFPGKLLDELSHFMSLCDVAKFAKRAFEKEDREQLHQSASTFIDYAEKERERMRL